MTRLLKSAWHLLAWCLAMCGASGCMSGLHPIRQPEEARMMPMLPCACKEHVYVFMVHGADPLDYANLAGVKDFCHDLGFPNVYLGQVYHGGTMLREIQRIKQTDGDARFVLVGFSAGANVVRGLANELQIADDTFIDLVVYLGGNTLKDVPASKPDNVGKVVNILATGLIWHGASINGAENVQYSDTAHFGSPSHQETLRMLVRELAEVAGRVGVVSEYSVSGFMDASGRADTGRMENALKPVSRLRALEEAQVTSTSPPVPPTPHRQAAAQPRK